MPNKEEDPSPLETATYISLLAKELRTLALRADLGFLAFLLAMTAEEAETIARGTDRESGYPPRSHIEE